MNAPHTSQTVTDPSARPAVAPAVAPWINVLRGAWQLHRTLVLTGIGAAAVVMVLLAGFRQRAVAITDSATARGSCSGGARSEDCQAAVLSEVWSALSSQRAALHLACLAVAVGAGLLIGAATFAREFEQRTQVFALTQSVRRISWWAAKTAVAVVPLTSTMLAMGGVASWAFTELPYQTQPMSIQQFYVPSSGLAVIYLLSVSVGLTAGVIVRSTVRALIAAVFIVGLSLVGGELIRPDLAPADRAVFAADGHPAVYPTGWLVGSGYLDAAGQEVDGVGYCSLRDTVSTTTTDAENQKIAEQCQAQTGIANSYIDVIPDSRNWQVRAAWSGILITLSALILVLGVVRIRKRVL